VPEVAKKFQLVLQNVAKHISLTPSETGFFLSLLQEKKIKKKEFLLHAGQSCKAISFVNTGALRAFHTDTDDKQSTIMFAITDWWITDINSFVNRIPALISIEAVENSELLQLTNDDLEVLFLKVPKFERFFRILMQNSYVREQQRVLQTLSLPAEQLYQNFLKKYPAFANKVPQKHIASYLGITPEFLSFIRKKKSKRSIS
jgi:CRP-like cAMP-binding protein